MSGLAFVNPKSLQRSERNTFRDFTRYHVGGSTIVRVATPLGGRGRGTLLIGADYALQDGAILFYSLTPQGTRGDTLRDNKGEGARSAGVFVTEELALGAEERWTVALGARYDAVTYDYRSYISPALNARRSFTGVSPKVGVTYRIGPLHSLYASVGGGIEVPAGNETDPVPPGDTVTAINPLLDPIRSTTLEVGTKRSVTLAHRGGGLVRELSYDVALYQTAVANEIVPYRGGRFYFTAGRVRRRGAEVGLRVAAAGGVALQAAVTVADHRYTRYLVDSVHYGSPGSVADYGGNRVVGVPALTDAWALDLAPPGLRPLRVRLGVQGVASFYADDANEVKIPGSRITTLTLGIDKPLEVFVTIHNLFDRRHIASAFLNPDVIGGEPVAFEPGMPRHVVVGVSLNRR